MPTLLRAILMSSTLVLSATLAGTVSSQITVDNPGAIADLGEITVTTDNFVRAATDLEFGKYLSLTGGVNRFFHFRKPTPIANQPTIRMNRDTLYSAVIVDISKGATLALPEVGDRYMTAMIVNQDHYINKVFSGGGTYTLNMDTFDTPYVIVILRTLVNSADPKDIAAVNALQDKMTIKAGSSKPYIVPNYDEDSFDPVLKAALELSRALPDSFRMFGPNKDVDPIRHFLGTAFGFGGLPENEAFYLNVEPGLPVGEYKIEVPANVPVEAFWSVSIYNAKGFFQANDRGGYVINSVTGTRNKDGGVTVHLGGCDENRSNCLPIMEGWNYAVRMYQPAPEILDGSWSFPSVEPVH